MLRNSALQVQSVHGPILLKHRYVQSRLKGLDVGVEERRRVVLSFWQTIPILIGSITANGPSPFSIIFEFYIIFGLFNEEL